MSDSAQADLSKPVTSNAPITVSFKWTLEEYLTSFAMHKRSYSYRSPGARIGAAIPTRLILGAVLLAGWVLLLLIIFQTQTFGLAQIAIALLVVAAAVLYFSSPLLVRREQRRHFEGRPDQNQMVTYTFTAEGVTTVTHDATGTVAWGDMTRLVHTRKGLLFYPNEATFNWVPSHAFSSPAQQGTIVEWAKGRVGRYMDLS